jgi:hypothetical protein
MELAHGLLAREYDVTVITGKSSLEIRSGHPDIAQFTLLEHQRALGLDLWSALSPRITGTTLRLYPPQSTPVTVTGTFPAHGVSVDSRVKLADWLEYFEDRGGKVVIHGITLSDLDYLSRMFDLIVIAVGHGELGQLFDTDATRSGGARERAVAQALIWDVDPESISEGQGGEYAEVGSSPEARVILAPILTQYGPCHSLTAVQGEAGGPMDAWPDRPGPEEQLRRMKDLLRMCTPHLFNRVKDASLIDGHSTSLHKIEPHVRHPVGRLPSGACVLGQADVISSTDPIAAQGSNTSSASAHHYFARILDRGDAEFTPAWMEETFTGFWNGEPGPDRPLAGVGQAAAALGEVLDRLWNADAPAHLAEVLGAATRYQEVADRFVQGLNDPRDYQSWLYDAESARAYLAKVTARH